MCIRRSSRHPKKKRKKDGQSQTGQKKLTCCQRCMRKIRRCICKRFRNCIKTRVFGTPNPELQHYEIAGYNLGSIKSKFKFNKKSPSINNNSVVKLYDKKMRPSKLTVKDIDLIEGISAKDLKKKFSIKSSKQHLLENMVEDYKKGNLSVLHLPNNSKLDARKLDKEQINNMLQRYEKVQNRIKNNADLNAEDLKKKFSLTGSKAVVLEKLVEDYKKGKTSATGLSRKSKFDPTDMNKEQLNRVLRKYEAAQTGKKRVSFIMPSKNKFQKLYDDVKNTNISIPKLSKNWFK